MLLGNGGRWTAVALMLLYWTAALLVLLRVRTPSTASPSLQENGATEGFLKMDPISPELAVKVDQRFVVLINDV